MNINKERNCERIGFTLVELLLVMAIISVLASLALAVIGDAQHDARANATRARMNQVDNLLTQRMENYLVRRVPLDDISTYVVGASNDDYRLDLRDLRRRILVDIVNAEMPRNLLNISYRMAIGGTPMNSTYPSRQFVEWVDDDNEIREQVVDDLSFQQPAFATRFIKYGEGNPLDPNENAKEYPEGDISALDSLDERRRTSSEYLYQILETTQLNGLRATTSLGSGAFGDTDNDGFLEVVDSWGEAIGFQFAIQDDDGNFITSVAADTTNPLGLGFRDLDASIDMPDGSAISVGNLRILLYSRGNGVEDITNTLQ